MTMNYDAIERAFGKLDVEITTKPGKGWFGGKHLEVSAKIKAPNDTIETTDGKTLNVLYPGLTTVKKSVKLGITDEGYDTVENTKKLGKLVSKTVSEAYMTRFLEMSIPDDAISDDYNGKRTKGLDDSDQFELRTHIEKSLETFANTLAKKLAETTGVTDIRPPSGGRTWFPDSYGFSVARYTKTASGENEWFLDLEGNCGKAVVYLAAERVMSRKIRERREENFLKEKSATYTHAPQDLAR